MQQAPNPEFYLCPTCNNQIRTQNRLLHEARCEFLRKTSASQIQQVPVNNYPSHQQAMIRNPNPPQNYSPPPVQYRPNQNQAGSYATNNRPSFPPPNQNFPQSNQRISDPRGNIPPVNPNQNPNNTELSLCRFCRQQIPTSELEEHVAYCLLAIEKCPHCFYEYPKSYLPSHVNSCPMLVAICPECEEDFPFEILQDHINANHIPPPPPENEQNKKREPSPSFFDKLKNIFSSNDKKEKPKTTKCKKCQNKIILAEYEKHARQCYRPPPPPVRNPENQLFSLMLNPANGRRMIVRQPSNGPRNNMNEMDLEARKMRELMLLMHMLLSQRPKEDPGMKEQEINDNSYTCKYDADKSANLSEDYKKCSICQCDFEQDEEMRIFQCLHRYHKECSDAWLKKKSWCPLCRKNVRSGQEEEYKEDDQ